MHIISTEHLKSIEAGRHETFNASVVHNRLIIPEEFCYVCLSWKIFFALSALLFICVQSVIMIFNLFYFVYTRVWPNYGVDILNCLRHIYM